MKSLSKILLVIIISVPLVSNAQTSTLEPIVIVPGILGSWNADVIWGNATDNGLLWGFHPWDHTWDNMLIALLDAGYEWNENLFVAFYDWRKSNADSAQNYLIPAIDKALSNSSSTKVNIIAYSMGGLVARSYIQSDDYEDRNDVNHFVMLGTPNYGSSDVYTLWEGGVVPRNWETGLRMFMSSIIDINNVQDFSVDDEYDVVHKYFPSIGELIPVYEFLVDKGSGNSIKPYSSLIQARNDFLEELNFSETGRNLQEVGGITVIAGIGESTVGNIPVVTRDASEDRLWVDGVPDPLTPERNNTEGDNRFLFESTLMRDIVFGSQQSRGFWDKLFAWFAPQAHAQFEDEDFLVQIEINSKHGDLPTEAIFEVFSALSLPLPIGDFEPPPEPDNITTFWFASPVEVKVTDPNGNVITKNSNNIPEAVYTGETDPNGVKMIIIPNGLPGRYKIDLIGIADGEYHMAAATFTDNSDNTVTVEKSIELGEKVEYAVDISHAGALPIEIGEPVITLPETEKYPIELVNELILDLENYYKDKKISTTGIYQSLLKDLKIVLKALEEGERTRPIGEKYPKLHELKVVLAKKLAIKKLESFISAVRKYNDKDKIEDLAAEDLITQAQAIISNID